MPPVRWTEFTPGSATPAGRSLPVDYDLEGFLLDPIVPGCPVRALRLRRNGVDALGCFSTTPVVEVHVTTVNSVYRVTAVQR